MTPKTALLHPHKASPEVKRIFDRVEGHGERIELNLYVSGYEDEPEEGTSGVEGREPPTESSQPGTPEKESESR